MTKKIDPLLVTRQDAARMLGGVSVMTIVRMEQRGALEPIRLNGGARNARVFYRYEAVLALATGVKHAG